MNICPNCESDRTRRGGTRVWIVYIVLIGLAIPAVLVFRLHAGIVGGIMLAAVVIAHLVFDQRVCLDCGTQWNAKSPDRNSSRRG